MGKYLVLWESDLLTVIVFLDGALIGERQKPDICRRQFRTGKLMY